MQRIHLEGFDQKLPDQMLVSVVMEKTPSSHAWVDFSYHAMGVISEPSIAGSNLDQRESNVKRIYQKDGVEHYQFSGLCLQLHVDECESYYHNLMSPHPGCFVVASEPEELDDMPVPYLVSLSFDEVHAYLEGDEQIYAVDIPPDLYQWTEAFVLTHYVATKRTKRKLKNWKEEARGKVTLQPQPQSSQR